MDFPTKGEVHYLPHHCVVNEEKETTKFRVVYDASSNKPSLNDCLEKGDNLMPWMLDVLIRFRGYKIALISDIEKAFLNVGVQEKEPELLAVFVVKGHNRYIVRNYCLQIYSGDFWAEFFAVFFWQLRY